jgi:hypothetical protein
VDSIAQLVHCTKVRNEASKGDNKLADVTVIVGRDYKP